MIAIRKYFVSFILVIGPGLADITLEDKNKFFSYILSTHNLFRKIHDARPVTFDQNLVDEARRQVVAFADGTSISATSNDYGVNKKFEEYVDDIELTFPVAVRLCAHWYAKARGYNYYAEPTTTNADEFTQIIWKNTTSIAVDVEIRGRTIYVVVVYSPAGNKLNQYTGNVGRAKNWKDVQLEEIDSAILNIFLSFRSWS